MSTTCASSRTAWPGVWPPVPLRAPGFHLGLQGRQWRAQLVGCIGDEAALALSLGIDQGEQAVSERTRGRTSVGEVCSSIGLRSRGERRSTACVGLFLQAAKARLTDQ